MITSGERGFTLVELLAALAVFAVSGLLALSLWTDAAVTIGEVGRAVRSSPVAHVTAQLRADLTSAVGVVGTDEWSGVGLAFQDASGRFVTWSRSGTDLVRSVDAPTGPVRSLFRVGVQDWRWRVTAAGMVEVRIVQNRRPRRALWRTEGTDRDPDQVHTEVLQIALRSASGGGW